MKKLLLLLLLIPVLKVNASTYYTDYYEIEKYEESSLVKKEGIKLYNTYQEVKNDLDYQETCENYYEDKYIIEELENKEKLDETYIKTQAIYPGDMLPINGFTIVSINNDTIINEIVITYNNNRIDFTVENNDSKNITLKKGDSLSVSFNEISDIKKLKISFKSDKPIDSLTVIKLVKNGRELFFDTFIDTYDITFTDYDEYFDLYQKYGAYENTSIVKPYYKKTIKKYLCYEIKKEKLNIYVEEGDNLLLDDYKIVNKYYKKDYIEISDDIITKNTDLKKLIISSSLDLTNLKIKHNINYNKTGNYNIDYIIGDKTFRHKITYVKENKVTPLIKTEYVEIEKECDECEICEEKDCVIKEYKDNININPILIIIILILLIILFITRKNRDND